MKTIFLTALVAVGTLFTSCSKDDNDSPSIVGSWKTSSSISEEFKDGVSQGKGSNSIDANNYEIFTFNNDNTFSDYEVSSNSAPSTDPGTYTMKDNIISLKYSGDTDIDSLSFTLTKDTLVTTFIEEYTSKGIAYKYVTIVTYIRQ
ncbi:lipocalin family protein [Flavobacterium sp. HJJ]|uniref:lipocalin family protein n=1 Tax=Flavobacterium sp. HJJ TaxID=2783792 RepID=UPI00188C03BA|nr:lipocalin family protein [Flavobacterium sp. HJJ]MBF4470621.1 lipocalin family protein [Flavobacterium sp. HJJ]